MSDNTKQRKRIIFLLSHPIQYFSPLFQLMAKDDEIDLLVLYCSDENVKGHIDKGFGVEVKWDIPLLEGYNYKFLKNNSWKPSIFSGFFGLMNFEIFKVLKNERGSYLVIHGWNYLTHLLTIVYGKFKRLKVCIRGDNTYKQEILKNKKLLFLKKIFLGNSLFKFIDYFLYVGVQNKKFYELYNVPEHKLIFTPHAVDNDRFRDEYEKYKNDKYTLRKKLGLPADKIIILTAGKYTPVKQPILLLKAYKSLNSDSTALVFLGDGELRNEMEKFIETNNLKDVYLTGFKNQSEVGKYYATADIFVLPSKSETWGLAVNEAMNFGLPIIVSDQVGCLDDLVINGKNGYSFTNNENIELKEIFKKILNSKNISSLGKSSLDIINNYSFNNIINLLKGI